jgi:hypothetical protein
MTVPFVSSMEPEAFQINQSLIAAEKRLVRAAFCILFWYALT